MIPTLAQPGTTLEQAVTIAVRIYEESKYLVQRMSYLRQPALVMATPTVATPTTPDLAQMINECVQKAVTAALAERRSRYNPNQNPRPQNQQRDPNRPPPICYKCHEEGHIIRNCPKNSQPPAQTTTTTALIGDSSGSLGQQTQNVWSLNY